jgi:hypothetical protein
VGASATIVLVVVAGGLSTIATAGDGSGSDIGDGGTSWIEIGAANVATGFSV